MTTGLLIIDVQRDIVQGAAPAERQKRIDAALDGMVARLQTIQQRARTARVPVFVVQHDGGPGDRLEHGRPGWALRPEIAPLPGEALIHKKSCDSFFETDLAAQLQAASIEHLVIGGCMTQFCVDTTVRRAVSLGYDVTLLADGHGTADMGDLTFEQIIAHHNRLLNGFDAGRHAVKVRKSESVAFP
jgi:nicotinamidase-related amidase